MSKVTTRIYKDKRKIRAEKSQQKKTEHRKAIWVPQKLSKAQEGRKFIWIPTHLCQTEKTLPSYNRVQVPKKKQKQNKKKPRSHKKSRQTTRQWTATKQPTTQIWVQKKLLAAQENSGLMWIPKKLKIPIANQSDQTEMKKSPP